MVQGGLIIGTPKTFWASLVRTRRIGANPEKSDSVNFRGPDWRKFSELCVLLFFLEKIDKMLPKSRFSKPIFGHSAGSTKLDRPYCKRLWLRDCISKPPHTYVLAIPQDAKVLMFLFVVFPSLLALFWKPLQQSADCKRGRKKGAARKLSKSVEKLFDTFWRFLTFFALRENCRKVSKNFWRFLTIFDVFWRGPFPPAETKGTANDTEQQMRGTFQNVSCS